MNEFIFEDSSKTLGRDGSRFLSIVLTTTGKIVTLPTDIYEAADKFAGVNYVNCVSIVNP